MAPSSDRQAISSRKATRPRTARAGKEASSPSRSTGHVSGRRKEAIYTGKYSPPRCQRLPTLDAQRYATCIPPAPSTSIRDMEVLTREDSRTEAPVASAGWRPCASLAGARRMGPRLDDKNGKARSSSHQPGLRRRVQYGQEAWGAACRAGQIASSTTAGTCLHVCEGVRAPGYLTSLGESGRLRSKQMVIFQRSPCSKCGRVSGTHAAYLRDPAPPCFDRIFTSPGDPARRLSPALAKSERALLPPTTSGVVTRLGLDRVAELPHLLGQVEPQGLAVPPIRLQAPHGPDPASSSCHRGP